MSPLPQRIVDFFTTINKLTFILLQVKFFKPGLVKRASAHVLFLGSEIIVSRKKMEEDAKKIRNFCPRRWFCALISGNILLFPCCCLFRLLWNSIVSVRVCEWGEINSGTKRIKCTDYSLGWPGMDGSIVSLQGFLLWILEEGFGMNPRGKNSLKCCTIFLVFSEEISCSFPWRIWKDFLQNFCLFSTYENLWNFLVFSLP